MTKQAKQTWNLKVAYKFTLEKQTHKTKSFVKGLNLSLNCPLQHKWPMTQNNLIQHKDHIANCHIISNFKVV